MLKTYEIEFGFVTILTNSAARYWRLRNKAVCILKEYGKEFSVYPIYSAGKNYIVGITVIVYGKLAKMKNLDEIMKDNGFLLKEAA